MLTYIICSYNGKIVTSYDFMLYSADFGDSRHFNVCYVCMLSNTTKLLLCFSCEVAACQFVDP